MENKWIKDLKDRLTDFEIEPPDGLWDAVNPEAAKPSAGTRSAKGFARYRAVAAAAAVASLFTAGVFYFTNDYSNMDLAKFADTEPIADRTTNLEAPNAPSENDIPPQPTNLAQLRNATTSNGNSVQELTSDNEGGADISVDIVDKSDTQGHSDVLESHETQAQGEPTDEHTETDTKLSLLDYGYEHMPSNSKRISRKTTSRFTSNKVSLGVMTTAGSFGYNNYSGDQSFASDISTPSNGQDNPNVDGPGSIDNNDNNNVNPGDGEDGENSDGNDNSQPKGISRRNAGAPDRVIPGDKADDITHHMPIKLGLTFLYRLNDKIGIETGLTYTYLSSDVKYQGGNPKFIDATQSLHYIGIPVNVKYRPLHWRWIDIYLSGGVAFDKCVSSSVRGRYSVSESGLYTTERVSLGEKPFQFSANISAGLQFNITSNLGLYVEPGASYYVNDGSSLSTFYKEHPLNFNINAGLRLSIGAGL